ncbi:hypothetical protein BGZ94_009965 [Podila epigama]|nr:hypothetical protein BGZ94_009965 [Podila epigama]
MAENLLASLLIFYKETGATPTSLLTLPVLLQDIQTHIASSKDLARANISSQGTPLELESFRLAADRAILDFNSGASLINARAVFNVMMACLIEDPLRVLAIDVCLGMLDQTQLSVFARKRVMEFILGPAEFIMHHLEWRISLLDSVNRLIITDSYADVEFRALTRRMMNKLGLQRQTTQIEKDKVRLYTYLELVVVDPVNYASLDSVSKQMSAAQWTAILQQDLVFYFYQRDFRPQMQLLLESLSILGVSPTLYAPDLVHNAIYDNPVENEDGTAAQLSDLCGLLIECFLGCKSESDLVVDEHGLRDAVDMALNIAFDGKGSVQDLLEASERRILGSIRLDDTKVVGGVLRMVQTLARFVIVSPLRFLPRILWMVVVLQRVTSTLAQSSELSRENLGMRDFLQSLNLGLVTRRRVKMI